MEIENRKQAIIYCRVSTKEQAEEGTSLTSQQKICEEYAASHDYDVREVFIEKGESAKTSERPELHRLQMYCSRNRKQIDALILYKIDRLSRNTDDYSKLRIYLKACGIEIISTTEYFEDTPAGRFMENIIANVAQFDNDMRTERTIEGMKAATQEGRYIWKAPIGYTNGKVSNRSNIIPDPDNAKLVNHAFKLIASGTHCIDQAMRKLEGMGLRTRNGKIIPKSYFHRMMKNPVYKGKIQAFGGEYQGTFKAIVEPRIFDLAQIQIKNNGHRHSAHKKDSEDFPLRRFVESPCDLKLTGCWSRGNGGHYAYYRFIGLKGGSYKKSDIEQKYKEFINRYSLDESYIKFLRSELKRHFDGFAKHAAKENRKVIKRLEALEEIQSVLVKKNVSGVISDEILKQQLADIEKEKSSLKLKSASLTQKNINVDKLLDFAADYLKNPSKAWEKANMEDRLKLQWFEHPKGVVFDGKSFRTKELASVFNVKSLIRDPMSPKAALKFDLSNQIINEL